jgi:hypothetical protein
MGLPGASSHEGAMGQAASLAPGITAQAAPNHAPSPTADPAETSPGMPHRELDAAHPGLDMH